MISNFRPAFFLVSLRTSVSASLKSQKWIPWFLAKCSGPYQRRKGTKFRNPFSRDPKIVSKRVFKGSSQGFIEKGLPSKNEKSAKSSKNYQRHGGTKYFCTLSDDFKLFGRNVCEYFCPRSVGQKIGRELFGNLFFSFRSFFFFSSASLPFAAQACFKKAFL